MKNVHKVLIKEKTLKYENHTPSEEKKKKMERVRGHLRKMPHSRSSIRVRSHIRKPQRIISRRAIRKFFGS